VAHILK